MFPTTKCAVCPRTKPGPCFAQAGNLKALCDRHAAGDMMYAPLLTGEVEPIQVNGQTSPVPTSPDTPARALFRLRMEQVNLCLSRECRTGCQKSRCWALLKGTRWNDEPYTEVTMSECVECVTEHCP